MPTPSAPAGPIPTGMPLFYRTVEPFHVRRHATAGMKAAGDYSFARTANALPLTAPEFFIAQAHYPIVFGPAGMAEALAVTGLRDGENLVVAADGRWQAGWYIPSYARRFPFILGAQPGRDDYHLCVETSGIVLNDPGATPLVTDGRPSDAAKAALDACITYQNHHRATQAFVTALYQHDLMVPQTARIEVKTSGGVKTFTLDGLWVVDEGRFNALPDGLFLDWRRQGWIALVHAHLMSMQRWGTLVDRIADLLESDS